MKHYDVGIIGTGSGNAIPPSLDGRTIALVERGVFGGTCVNVGCIPSKMLIYPADLALHARESGRLGVHSRVERVDWPAIVDRVFGQRIDLMATGGERYRAEECPDIDLYRGHGTFVDHKTLEVDGERFSADQWIIAAGARPFVPPIPGLADAGYHTSDDVMRLPELPERLLVLGGGYIANELGHVFDAFGVRTTIVNRGPYLLRSEDGDISRRFTEIAARRFDLRLQTVVTGVERSDAGILVSLDGPEGSTTIEVDELLVATGRIPNSDQLGLEHTGVRTDSSGRIIVHETLETTTPGIWALGDIANHHQLKHVANAEARVVFHNVANPDDRTTMDYSIIPHAVFANPQVASVGLTERQVAGDAVPFIVASKEYGSTAYGWAMEDTTSFVKLIAHAHTRRLLGAHIIGPQAPTLIQMLIQGMRFGQTVDEMAREQMWIHPALTEVIENTLLEF